MRTWGALAHARTCMQAAKKKNLYTSSAGSQFRADQAPDLPWWDRLVHTQTLEMSLIFKALPEHAVMVGQFEQPPCQLCHGHTREFFMN